MELLNFINAGGYAQITAAKVRELVECFHLSGVVLVGHCAGTVSAIEASALCTQECKGLVLLDPYFHLPQAVRPKLRRQLSDWALQSRLGGLVSNVYDRLRKVRLMWRRNMLPQNANLPLLNAWRALASSGTPILLLKAPARKAAGTTPRTGEFDYLKYILEIAGRRSRVEVELVEGTDHSFANRKGRLAVRLVIERWLRVHFPLSRQEARWGNAFSNRAHDGENRESQRTQWVEK
jgi:pimeloyl-ACP methyl ester carboxylesterase